LDSGYLISFEGGEGTGKSTQIDLLSRRLKEAGCEVVVTKEPGGTRIGEKIRKILLEIDNKNMDSFTELLLYTADRAQDLAENIKPALKKGKIVLTDRYIDSNIVYQGYGRKIDRRKIRKLNNWIAAEYWPDLTILLDIEVEKGLKRARNLSNKEDRLEAEIIDFHRRIRRGYQELAQKENRIIKFDADKTIEELHSDIWRKVNEQLTVDRNDK